ncbi:unnamed protein product [Darwinula stevensoni]|uniref:Metaxin 2 n=1 Tax=Darwinula stevensoni TaxID=69355 RepID=A0A7R9A3S5_9CRUS|nr:unnamed protein product [Darwinula stevensoni]CAG0882757.1 unnamed protein product [Darwinula stevensoni]
MTKEPWPDDVKLFQPHIVEQILLPDYGNCLAVQVFLRMCGLDFQVEMRANAEFMSPTGKVPFLQCGTFLVAEMDPIIAFVNNKGISLSSDLDNSQRADMKAYMSLINDTLYNAELYISWVDDLIYEEVTKPRYGSVFPWPLNKVIPWQRKRQMVKRLSHLGWGQKTSEQVYQEVDKCCHALSERLGTNQKYFFGRATELDALAFGHLYTILTTDLPDNRLASTVRHYQNLVTLCEAIEEDYFPRVTESDLIP